MAETAKMNESTLVTSVTDSQTITLVDANGGLSRIKPANLQAAVMDGIPATAVMDGVFIMYHRKSDNYPLAVKLDKWTSLQAGGEIADGVMIVEGSKHLVIAPTESSLYWSSASVSGGGTTTSDRVTAINDWNGKANTAAQGTHSECSDAAYAPGFCNTYSRTNANGQGLTAGKWWLPSIGELMCMYANMRKINYALSLISGATQLAENWYWSSTEYSPSYAWDLYFVNGYLNYWHNKVGAQFRVRPVSAFIS
jgi:hypothetical protein